MERFKWGRWRDRKYGGAESGELFKTKDSFESPIYLLHCNKIKRYNHRDLKRYILWLDTVATRLKS